VSRFLDHGVVLLTGADPGFAKGDHGERVEREPTTGVWGSGTGGETARLRGPLKLKAFHIFSHKKGQKFSI